MDIQKEKKKGIKKKHIYIAGGIILFSLLIYQAFFSENMPTLKVDAKKLSIEAVTEGIFHDYITVTGNVEPIATIYLDAREGGRVEEKVIEEGGMVKKGDVILRLSNPDLSLSILNSEAQLAERSYELYLERQKQDSIYRNIQVKQMEDNLHNMDLILKLVRQRQDNLNVMAPANGQLTTMDAELGQSISKRGRIGQIHILTSFKVVAQIDEHYIDKVKIGLTAILERQGYEYQLKIRKVLPDVRNGRFAVEMIFDKDTPDNMRTGQTYYTRLQLGSPEESMLLPRGSFFQETGGQWIFVVSADGKSAEKRKTIIGRQNSQYYELLEGLQPGEKIIVSGYDSFGDNEKLVFN